MTWENQGVTIADPEQVVLESDPFRRLSYTWHTFTPELAEAFGWSAEKLARLEREPRSKVTLRHRAGRREGQAHRCPRRLRRRQPGAGADRGGWPVVLSELKTLLERDDALVASSGTAR